MTLETPISSRRPGIAYEKVDHWCLTFANSVVPSPSQSWWRFPRKNIFFQRPHNDHKSSLVAKRNRQTTQNPTPSPSSVMAHLPVGLAPMHPAGARKAAGFLPVQCLGPQWEGQSRHPKLVIGKPPLSLANVVWSIKLQAMCKQDFTRSRSGTF